MSYEIEDSILSGMRAQRRLLDAAIAAYEAFKSGAVVAPAEVASEFGDRSGGSTDVPNGAFNGLTVPAAVKLYLKIVNKKQTTAEIVAGLKKGEMESTAKNFYKLVAETLKRLWKVKRELIKTGESWALPEFFSPQVRASLSQEPVLQKASGKKLTKKKTAKAAQRPKAASVASQRPPQPAPTQGADEGGPAARIEALLRHSGKAYTIQEAAGVAQISPKVAQMLLGTLVRRKKAEKMPDGKYRALASEAQPMPVAS